MTVRDLSRTASDWYARVVTLSPSTRLRERLKSQRSLSLRAQGGNLTARSWRGEAVAISEIAPPRWGSQRLRRIASSLEPVLSVAQRTRRAPRNDRLGSAASLFVQSFFSWFLAMILLALAAGCD